MIYELDYQEINAVSGAMGGGGYSAKGPGACVDGVMGGFVGGGLAGLAGGLWGMLGGALGGAFGGYIASCGGKEQHL